MPEGTNKQTKAASSPAASQVCKVVFSCRLRSAITALEIAAIEANDKLSTWQITPDQVKATEDIILPEAHVSEYIGICIYTLSVNAEQAEQIREYLASIKD